MRCSLVFVGCVWATILEDLHDIRSQIDTAIDSEDCSELWTLRSKIQDRIRGLRPEEARAAVASCVRKEDISKCIRKQYYTGINDLLGILKSVGVDVDRYIDVDVVDKVFSEGDSSNAGLLFFYLANNGVNVARLISLERVKSLIGQKDDEKIEVILVEVVKGDSDDVLHVIQEWFINAVAKENLEMLWFMRELLEGRYRRFGELTFPSWCSDAAVRSWVNEAIDKRDYRRLRRLVESGDSIARYVGKEEISKCIEGGFIDGGRHLVDVLREAGETIEEYIDQDVVDRAMSEGNISSVQGLFCSLWGLGSISARDNVASLIDPEWAKCLMGKNDEEIKALVCGAIVGIEDDILPAIMRCFIKNAVEMRSVSVVRITIKALSERGVELSRVVPSSYLDEIIARGDIECLREIVRTERGREFVVRRVESDDSGVCEAFEMVAGIDVETISVLIWIGVERTVLRCMEVLTIGAVGDRAVGTLVKRLASIWVLDGSDEKVMKCLESPEMLSEYIDDRNWKEEDGSNGYRALRLMKRWKEDKRVKGIVKNVLSDRRVFEEIVNECDSITTDNLYTPRSVRVLKLKKGLGMGISVSGDPVLKVERNALADLDDVFDGRVILNDVRDGLNIKAAVDRMMVESQNGTMNDGSMMNGLKSMLSEAIGVFETLGNDLCALKDRAGEATELHTVQDDVRDVMAGIQGCEESVLLMSKEILVDVCHVLEKAAGEDRTLRDVQTSLQNGVELVTKVKNVLESVREAEDEADGLSRLKEVLEEDAILTKCGICHGGLNENVSVAGCKHCFCRNCLEQWLRVGDSCPVCRDKVERFERVVPGR